MGPLKTAGGAAPRRYCQRLRSPDFWGGNVELLLLAKMLKVSAQGFNIRGLGTRPAVPCSEDKHAAEGSRRISMPCRDTEAMKP